MSLFYNLSIRFFSLLLRFAFPFNNKARQIRQGRKQTFDKLRAMGSDRPVIWVHCASLGEFEQGRPVIETIKKHHPEYRILLTFFSPSGYEIRKNYELADCICYLPADTPANARRFLSAIKPAMVFFVKYEFWYNYINEIKKHNIPLYIFSAIFREDQMFFKSSPWAKWYRKMLFRFDHLFVQDQSSIELLNGIGVTRATIAGDTRYDRVAEIARNGKHIPLAEAFKGDSLLVVVGSSWKPDEELLADYVHAHPEIKFIVAPHETKRANVERLTNLLKTSVICYTEATETSVMNKQVLIVDTIGMLSSLYRYADLAYIGGGFGVGIHNTLEAAIFGMPILFGPNYLKFFEAVSMAKLGIAFPVSHSGELTETLDSLLSNNNRRKQIAAACVGFTNQNLGATKVILNKVFNN